ncbi:MAG: zinc ribbon domain-containing protein, partial [Clostridia bacterium]|nr:zinc ribbon domain-containing protein [Clostridia bacterium]
IVPVDLFERVQDMMKANKKAPAKHKAEDEYLLTTKLFCGKCKCLMAGESGTSHTKHVHRYYKCVSVKYHRGCDKKTVRKEWIEDIVISYLMKIIFDDDLMDKLADALLIHLHKENDTLPILQKQFAETQKSIDNMLNAIQQGIFTTSTKERLEALEREKSELSVQIMKEELSRPNLTKEQILFWIHKFRKLNPKKLEHRRRLINSFLNSVYLFDDKIIIDCNYKDGTETITFEEIENSALGSDLTSLAAPRRSKVRFASTFLYKKVIRPLPCFSSFAKSLAWLTCSVVNALTTARCRYQLFASFILTRYEHPHHIRVGYNRLL